MKEQHNGGHITYQLSTSPFLWQMLQNYSIQVINQIPAVVTQGTKTKGNLTPLIYSHTPATSVAP